MFVQYYTQLFVLLVISVIHVVAVFYPVKFRAFSYKDVQMIDFIIVAVAVVGTVPSFTVYCDFYYSVFDHIWMWDPKKPCTDVYKYSALLLQSVCMVIVVCADVLIIWKLRKHRLRSMLRVRKKATVATVFLQSTHVQEVCVSNEVRLAFNYILLSSCFLIMAIIYQANAGAFLYGSIYYFAYNLNIAKWSIYALGNEIIRKKLLSLLLCG
ncbi:hypothetical protein GCK32_011876 [Trichostrongylus colubriformis]|uniref:7TM GPCR serpentine receptor class x (Srx) domain-containing protein n=1 Tax=Trichostrongylus colubriformis TaxID=6319 RepID=A0AAN8F4M1_TRICO